MKTWLVFISWQIPGLRHYCHRCDLILWGWNTCPHKRRWYAG